MSLNTFDAGTRLEYHGQFLISHGRGPNGKVKLANKKLRTTQYLHPQKLEDAIDKGVCRILPPDEMAVELRLLALSPAPATPISADLSSMPLNTQLLVHRRLSYITTARDKLCGRYGPTGLTPVIAEVAEATNDQNKPNWRTVKRWIDRFNKYGVKGLIVELKGNAHGRLDDLVEQLIERAIEEHYFQTHRPPLTATHLHLSGLIEEENEGRSSDLQLFVPSYHTFKRRLAEYDKYDVLCGRFGVAYANRWFRTYNKSPRAERPFEVIQVDHTPLDVECTFRGIFRLGKPYLTLARDQFTGAIVGLHLTFDPPSYSSVMQCLQMVFSRKILPPEVASRCKHGWDMHGLIERLRVDNGLEFKGLDLQNAAAQLGFDIEFCPPRKPWFKAQVERALGTLRTQVISRLRARTFTVREDQRDGSTEFEPLLDLEELQHVLMVWAITVHNERPYVATGMPPRLAWEAGIRTAPPRNDRTETEINVYLGACVRRALHPYGIELRGLTFASPELTCLRQQIQRHPHFVTRDQNPDEGKLLVKYSPQDLGSVYVLDPLSNTYIEAKCSLPDYAQGLTMHRHRLNLAHARHIAKGTVNVKDLLEADRQLDKMIEGMSVTAAERLGGALARAMSRSPEAVDLKDDDFPEGLLFGETSEDGSDQGSEQTQLIVPTKSAATVDLDSASPSTMPPSERALPAPTYRLPLVDDDIDDLADSWTLQETK